ncbi:MAG: sugar ABC transporter substrate-binding protein, partial [Methylobacteriaceae bacterium]|nr:sugar ABC transporter substrate-binding protein [Methylobacteriaceae bacterium]
MSKRFSWLSTSAAALFAITLLGGASAMAQQITVGLITKTNTNPFFVKMKEGADAK